MYGAWVSTTTGRVIIQTAPTLADVTFSRLGATRGISPVAIDYTLVDNQGDLADLECEFAQDIDEDWHRCAEFLAPRSEGRYDLTSSPIALLGVGGIRHRFVWDPSGQFDAAPATFLKLTVRDDFGETSKIIALPGPVSPRAVAPVPGEDVPKPGYRNHALIFGIEGADANEGVGLTNAVLRGLVTGDFNKDGETDVAAAYGDGTVAAFLGKRADGTAQGTFEQSGSTDVEFVPADLVAGDFDCDGNLDLATANEAANGSPTTVLLGDGVGGFAVFGGETDYTALYLPRALAVGDFDEDGCDDLAIVHSRSLPYNETTLSVTAKGPNQVFLGSNNFSPAFDLRDVAVSDVNNDGILDLALIDGASSSMLVMLGTGTNGLGDGGFASTVPSQHSVQHGPNAIAASDLNQDGAAELVVASSEGVTYFSNDGAGTLASSLISNKGSIQAAIADISGDLVPDVLIGCHSTDATLQWLDIFPGNDEGGVGPPFSVSEPTNSSRQISQIAVAQVGGDRAPDLIYSANGASIHQLRRDIGSFRGYFDSNGHLTSWGEGDYAPKRHGSQYTLLPQPNVSLPVDIDRDGDVDLVVGGGDPAVTDDGDELGMVVMRGFGSTGPGQASFMLESFIPTTFVLYAMAAGDFDGDGVSDIAAAGTTAGVSPEAVVGVFLGNGADVGDFTFTAGAILSPPSTAATAIVVTDLNADGVNDIVTANSDNTNMEDSDETLTVFVGSGDGTFSSPQSLAAASNETSLLSFYQDNTTYDPRGLAVCDINTDGRPDLITTAYSVAEGGGVSVLLGDTPAGTFLAQARTSVTVNGHDFDPLALACADVDEDGIPDVILAGIEATAGPNGDGAEAVLFGDGTDGVGLGTLSGQKVFSFNPIPYVTLRFGSSVAVGDVTGDGHPDLVVGSTQFGVILRQGTGNRDKLFGDDPTYYPPEYDIVNPPDLPRRQSVVLADVDNDEVPDVIVTDALMRTVTLLSSHKADREPWRRQLAAWSGADTNLPAYTPASMMFGGVDRFGRKRAAPSISQYLAALAPDGSPDFNAALRRATLQGPADPAEASKGVLLTRPWRIAGDIRFSRVTDPDLVGTAGPRLQLLHTFGALHPGAVSEFDFDREGSDLASTDFALQRGFVVALPIEPQWKDSEIDPTRVHVFQAVTDYVRASNADSDPFALDSRAQRFLPRVSDGAEGYRDVVFPKITWRSIPMDIDGDFATGQQAGPRFIVALTAPGERRIEVLTEKLGTFQALLVLH